MQGVASNSAIRTAPAVYETDTSTSVAYTNSGNSHCSGSNITMLNIAPNGSTPMSFAWCAQFNGGGSPIVTSTDGTANAIVWVPGAEGDNELHGYNAATGAVVFSGTGHIDERPASLPDDSRRPRKVLRRGRQQGLRVLLEVAAS